MAWGWLIWPFRNNPDAKQNFFPVLWYNHYAEAG
jgi:hypothetical protein